MKEAGLSDYLALLSICQTCRYKGVSFLKFMLSRETDLELFCEGKHLRRVSAGIEVYPKGFVPPHTCERRTTKIKEEKCPGSEEA
jgi:hypothetical protein